jgi:hypothetical protein
VQIQHLAAHFIGQDNGGGACRVKDRKWEYLQIWEWAGSRVYATSRHVDADIDIYPVLYENRSYDLSRKG